ncbi:hypothetical protein [Sphingomonas arenae]|uniref:hypothetical protein n=1 Tax=Sphingomonas arenae TaxID=2812555 RepID=UPI001967EEAB|nr:hypothetical protein [Sphingomonas arenae]
MGWFRKSEATGHELLGRWKVDPTDTAAVEAYGDAALEFDERGNLIYIVKGQEKDQIILLTYRVVGNVLITDQPSHPDRQSTHFKVSGDALDLTFGGQPARFRRAAA